MDVCLPNDFSISHTVSESADDMWTHNHDLSLSDPIYEPSWLGAEAWVTLDAAPNPRRMRGRRSSQRRQGTATAADPCWQVL